MMTNFEKGLSVAKFLRENTPTEPIKTSHGFPITDYEAFKKRHCAVIENKSIYDNSYKTYVVWYLRAYEAKEEILKQQEKT